MSKGLKATKVLKNGLVDESVMIITRKCFDKQIDIIETELKAFETIERVLKEYGLQDYLRITENVEDYPNIEDFYELIRYPENRITSKEQKALQIIKEKKVDVLELSVCANYETFISFFKLRNWNGEYNSFILTQEEYDLLKEVLLCE